MAAEDVRARISDADGRTVALYLVLVLLAAFFITPLWGGLMASIKSLESFARTLPFAPPGLEGWSTVPFETAWARISPSLVNSFMFTIPAAVFSAILGSFAAFGLTMVRWRGQTGLMVVFICAVFLPGQAVLIPLSRFWSIVDLESVLANLGPFNLWALPLLEPYHADIIVLIVTHTAFGVSICTLLFRGYYKQMNRELVEAAQVDGASITRIYRRVVLPLSLPMFAVVFIFQFTTIWNEFLYGLVLTRGGEAAPATVALNSLSSGFEIRYNHQNAGAILVALPTLIVYILFGKQFVKGIATESGED